MNIGDVKVGARVIWQAPGKKKICGTVVGMDSRKGVIHLREDKTGKTRYPIVAEVELERAQSTTVRRTRRTRRDTEWERLFTAE